MSKWIVTAPFGNSGLTYDLEFDNESEAYETAYRTKGAVYRKADGLELNENQQIVFQYLVNECLENDLTYALWQFTDDVYEEPAMNVELSPHVRAWKELSDKERLLVLAAVMEKGLKEVAE